MLALVQLAAPDGHRRTVGGHLEQGEVLLVEPALGVAAGVHDADDVIAQQERHAHDRLHPFPQVAADHRELADVLHDEWFAGRGDRAGEPLAQRDPDPVGHRVLEPDLGPHAQDRLLGVHEQQAGQVGLQLQDDPGQQLVQQLLEGVRGERRVDDGLQTPGLAGGGGLGGDQARVVDGQRSALGQLLGERDVGLLVVPARLGRHQREHAEDPAPGGERHGDGRLWGEASGDLAHLGIGDRALEELVGDLWEPPGPAGSHHLRHPGPVLETMREPPAKVAGELDLGGVDVGDGDVRQLAVLVHEVDPVPVGQRWDDELAELLQRALVVEGRVEDVPRLGQRPPSRALGLGRLAQGGLPRDPNLAGLGRPPIGLGRRLGLSPRMVPCDQ